ncbi:protein disulfide-isomerase [Malassezia sp. CBS 17886]|nr:protein disulfide-isomerase [Malassezia sp. CBS 17886]
MPDFPPATELTDANFTLVQTGAWLLEFYSPYCPHCRNFAPVWDALAERSDRHRTDPAAPLRLARVNCVVYMDLCAQEQIDGYPQLSFYVDGNRTHADIPLDRSLDALLPFVDEQAAAYRARKGVGAGGERSGSGSATEPPASGGATGAPASGGLAPTSMAASEMHSAPAHTATDPASASAAALPPLSPLPLSTPPLPPVAPLADLTELGSATLPDAEALAALLGPDRGQGVSFVKFYAPWCPHCKAMKPAYEDLGRVLQGQVNTVAVDCVRFSDLCQQAFNIHAFPTLRLYRNGSFVPYEHGERTQKAMLQWIAGQGAYEALRPVAQAAFGGVLQEHPVVFLYLDGSGAPGERQIAAQARLAADSRAPFLSTTDPVLVDRYAEKGAPRNGTAARASSLLVFKDGRADPMARLSMHSVAGFSVSAGVDQVSQWIGAQGRELLQALTDKDLHAALYNTAQAPVVLGLLRAIPTAPQDEQVRAMEALALAWHAAAPSTDVRFAWLDARQWQPLFTQEYHVEVGTPPQLFYVDTRQNRYYTLPSVAGNAALDTPHAVAWIKAVRAGKVDARPFGSVLDRTLSTVRVSSASAQSVVAAHPFLALLVVVGALLLVPRVRCALLSLRGTRAQYRKLV